MRQRQDMDVVGSFCCKVWVMSCWSFRWVCSDERWVSYMRRKLQKNHNSCVKFCLNCIKFPMLDDFIRINRLFLQHWYGFDTFWSSTSKHLFLNMVLFLTYLHLIAINILILIQRITYTKRRWDSGRSWRHGRGWSWRSPEWRGRGTRRCRTAGRRPSPPQPSAELSPAAPRGNLGWGGSVSDCEYYSLLF